MIKKKTNSLNIVKLKKLNKDLARNLKDKGFADISLDFSICDSFGDFEANPNLPIPILVTGNTGKANKYIQAMCILGISRGVDYTTYWKTDSEWLYNEMLSGMQVSLTKQLEEFNKT